MSKLIIVTDTPELEAILDKNPGWGPHSYILARFSKLSTTVLQPP